MKLIKNISVHGSIVINVLTAGATGRDTCFQSIIQVTVANLDVASVTSNLLAGLI